MTLSIRAWWPEGQYAAATLDPAVAEWPPSPARLFAALRASAGAQDGSDALEWLEGQGPPIILADEEVLSTHGEAAYVVINAIEQAGGNLTHPGRSNGLRSRASSSLLDSRTAFVWPRAAPPRDVLDELKRLSADVPYLGRSTSPVILSVDEEPPPPDEPHWAPTTLGRGAAQLPVPYPGFTAELDDAYVSGARPWERYRMQDYQYVMQATAEQRPEPAPLPSPYAAPLVLHLAEGSRFPGTVLGVVTAALRRAVMSRVPDPLPPELSGHGANGRPHVAFLGLVDVGHAHADGHLLAVAISVPAASQEVGVSVAQAVLAPPELHALSVRGIGSLTLRYEPTLERPWGATADRWTLPSQTWFTVTPMVLDRHARRGLTEEEIVAAGVAAAGYPRPARVELSSSSFVPGGLYLRRHQLPRRDGDYRPCRHARISFVAPVSGPVLVGALRHLGFGLCVPDPSTRAVPGDTA